MQGNNVNVTVVDVYPVESVEQCHLVELAVFLDAVTRPIDIAGFTQEIPGQPRECSTGIVFPGMRDSSMPRL